MTPIVNGLQERYNGQVTFEYLVANDNGAGQAAFSALGLPGHPSVVIMTPDGREHFRGFGVLETTRLDDAIQEALSS
ncbi:MAG: hypothetical protein RLP44_07520 [Aggregatilineales bacterium]